MTTQGSFARVIVNGVEITPDAVQSTYQHAYGANAVMAQNVGVKQYAPGLFNPTYQLNGYERHGMGALTAHNLLFPSGIGGANDTEFVITELLGNNAPPAPGDCAVLFDGTLLDYKRLSPFGGILSYSAAFKARGKRMPPFPVLLYDSQAIKTTSTFNSTPYDDGAESASTAAGAVGVLQVYSPTGTAASGSLSLTGQPNDGDTFTVGIGATNYVYTFKTVLTPSPGQVLIGGNVAATAANLFAAMTGGIGAGTTYATGTIPIPGATLIVAVPTSSQVIALTAVVTGTAANAYTLSASPNVSGKLAVSGATFSGGINGDQYSVSIASATSSGGSYNTLCTFSNVGPVRAAYRIEVPIGTIINEWLRLTFTLTGGSGTSQTFAACCCFGRWWQL